VGRVVDWKDYYQTNKGRLLGIGGILTVVGLVLYFARGNEATLVLPIVGIVLLIAGIIYKPRKKPENVTSDPP
jgi:uncharacterized membrane protein HdeD (DUF308 family)